MKTKLKSPSYKFLRFHDITRIDTWKNLKSAFTVEKSFKYIFQYNKYHAIYAGIFIAKQC